MDNEEQEISDRAIIWVKSHQRDIVQKFAGQYPSVNGIPVSIFMAGSPGAGKTEFSKRLLLLLRESIVRIDPDEVRNFLPQYTPGKAHLFQGAVSVAVEKIHDHVLGKRKDFLLDGTFSNLTKARENIRRSVEKNRTILIQYVYQDPLVAWDFTKKREAIEGRNIPKESFIEQLFAARDNVNIIKSEFGDMVAIDLVRRNIQTDKYDMEIGVQQVADKVLVGYTRDSLKKTTMTLIRLISRLFDADKTASGHISVRSLGGDSVEKRRLYERALEGAAADQKKIVEEYKKKFEYQR